MRTAGDVLDFMEEDKMSDAKSVVRYPYLIIFGIFALLACWAYAAPDARANAGPGMHGNPKYGHGRGMHDFVGGALHGLLRHQTELVLSEEQTGKIKAIVTDYEKSRIQKEADVKLAELDVRERIHDEKAELSSIESALRKAETARTAMRLGGVKAFRAATALLTPEQKVKWHQIMEEKREAATHGKGFKERSRMTPQGGSHDQPMKEG